MNESKNLRGIMTFTHELPTIKKLEINEEADPYGLLRMCGIAIAAALSMIQFAYF